MHTLLVLAALLAPPPTGSIAGRVTIESGGPRHVVVMLFNVAETANGNRPIATAATDDEGRYHFDGLAAGEYVLLPAAPGWIGDFRWSNGAYGKAVSVGDGEAVQGVDVALSRGGVVTGRVTDSDGRPVIGERVELMSVGSGRSQRLYFYGNVVRTTDDRGVYRIYGVPPGRYLVSVGVGENESRPRSVQLANVGYYPKTYYPTAASEDVATPVEISAASEARGIDIVVGRREKTYRAHGRVVEADTGKPIANARIGYGLLLPGSDGHYQWASTVIAYKADANGEFTMDSVRPGHYAAFVAGGSDASWPWYGDPATFEVVNADVDGVEIRLERGVRLSGVVVLERVTDPALQAKLTTMRVWARSRSADETALQNPYSATADIAPDGSFSLDGVSPGDVSIGFGSWPRQKGFMLIRLERDGVTQTGPMRIAAGDDVAGLRVVVGYGMGTIRGHVVSTEGALPDGARSYVWLKRAGAGDSMESTSADARNQFLFDGLPAGDYELTVDVSKKGGRMVRATKTVTVADHGETPVEIAVDFGEGEGGAQ